MALDKARYRSIEEKLWHSYGLTPSERYVPMPDGSKVRVNETGNGPAVLFLHGTGASGVNWAPLLAGLPEFRCIAIDRPGCGLSDAPNGGQGFSGLAEFNAFTASVLPAILDGLELSSAHVVSTSFGSYFAMLGAAADPSRVERLAMIAYPFGAPILKIPVSMRMAALPGMEQMMARIPPNRFAVKVILKQLGLGPALKDGRFTDEMFDWFLSVLRDTDTLRADRVPKIITFIKGQNPDVVLGPQTLDKLTMPTLLIWGEHDPMGNGDTARAFAAQLPDATLELLEDAAHAPWIDEAKRTAELTGTFLLA